MSHRFEIRKNKRGEYVAYFIYNSETIWWTEGYSSKLSAKNAIASVLKNGPNCEIVDNYDKPKKETKTVTEAKVDGIKTVKDMINTLTYGDMLALARGIQDHIYMECDAPNFAEGLSAWANS